MDQLDLPLLLALFQKEVGVSDDLVTLSLYLLDFLDLGEELHIVFLIILHALFGKELFTHISFAVKLLRTKLDVDEVGFLEDLVYLVHFLSLQVINM
jgi:hypothetical protein